MAERIKILFGGSTLGAQRTLRWIPHSEVEESWGKCCLLWTYSSACKPLQNYFGLLLLFPGKISTKLLQNCSIFLHGHKIQCDPQQHTISANNYACVLLQSLFQIKMSRKTHEIAGDVQY